MMPNLSCPGGYRRLLCLALAVWLVLTTATPALALFGFSIKDERDLGDKFAVLLRAQMPFVDDPEIVGYVRQMVDRLSRQMPAQPWPIETNVINNSALNAFAGPAGKVYVFSGLILGVQHESELAGVLAHELAHVSQRHLAGRIETMQKLTPLALLGIVTGALVGREGGAALALGSLAGIQTASLAYTRENERDADQIGLNYLLAANYPPQGLVGAFHILKRKQLISGGSIPPYLMTHPLLEERIAVLGDRIQRLTAAERERQDDDRQLRRVQTLLRARYTDPEYALRHFEDEAQQDTLAHLGRAICYDRTNRVNQAAEQYAAAVATAPSDPLILRESGRFHFERGRFEEAGRQLQKAVLLNPGDLMALFFYARLQDQLGNHNLAIDAMQRVARQVPEDPEVRYHLGRIQGQAGNVFQGHLQLAYSALYSNDRKKTEFQAAEARRHVRSDEDKRAMEDFEVKHKARAEFWK